jgi:hypothetical protein
MGILLMKIGFVVNAVGVFIWLVGGLISAIYRGLNG